MSLATFYDSMAEITLEFSDRNIYNDITSQIEVNLTPVTTTTPAVYGADVPTIHEVISLADGESVTRTFYTQNGRSALSWSVLSTASAMKMDDNSAVGLPIHIDSSNSTSATVTVTNNKGFYVFLMFLLCSYRYLKTGATTNTITGSETLMVRESDSISIGLYGRRAMNLAWPMGQTQAQTNELARAYLAKYKDPVPKVTLTVKGSTEELIYQILNRRVSDLITVVNNALGLYADFFINTVNVSQSVGGLLMATWELEYARSMEVARIFTLDNSNLDGTDVVGW